MKKLLAIILALAIVFSLSAMAFADGESVPSPKRKNIGAGDLPSTTSAEIYNGGSSSGDDTKATIIPYAEMNDDQKAEADKAVEKVSGEGYLPIEEFMVQANGKTKVIVEVHEGEMVFVVYPTEIQSFELKDLDSIGNDRYEVEVDGDCIVVVAKQQA